MECWNAVDKRWRRLSLRLFAYLARAAWQAVFSVWHLASQRIAQEDCQHGPEYLTKHSNRYADQVVCDEKKGGCKAILAYFPSALTLTSRETKQQSLPKSKAKPGNLETRAQRVQATGSEILPDTCPRCQNVFHTFRTSYGQTILRCNGWTSPTKACTFIKALPEETLPCGRWPLWTTSEAPAVTSSRGLQTSQNQSKADSASASGSGKQRSASPAATRQPKTVQFSSDQRQVNSEMNVELRKTKEKLEQQLEQQQLQIQVDKLQSQLKVNPNPSTLIQPSPLTTTPTVITVEDADMILVDESEDEKL